MARPALLGQTDHRATERRSRRASSVGAKIMSSQTNVAAGVRTTAILAMLALMGAVAFWAGNMTIGRAYRDEFEPVALNFYRWVLGLAVLLPFIAHRLRANWEVVWRERRLIALLGLSGVFLFQTVNYIGLAATPAFNAFLVMATTPALLLVANALLSKTWPPALHLSGIFISMAGAAWLITRGDLSALIGLSFYWGDLWIFLAALLWTAYTLLLRGAPKDLDPWTALAGSIAISLPMMAPFAAESLWRAPLNVFEPAMAAIVVYVAIFASVLAFWLWGYGVAQIGPVRAGQFLNLMPIFGGVMAVAFLGEKLEAYHAVGAVLVFAGVVLVNRRATGQ